MVAKVALPLKIPAPLHAVLLKKVSLVLFKLPAL